MGNPESVRRRAGCVLAPLAAGMAPSGVEGFGYPAQRAQRVVQASPAAPVGLVVGLGGHKPTHGASNIRVFGSVGAGGRRAVQRQRARPQQGLAVYDADLKEIMARSETPEAE